MKKGSKKQQEKSNKGWKYDLCWYCQTNKPNPDSGKRTTLSRITKYVPLVVATYIKTEYNEVIIPRCSECYERQQKKIKKSAFKCFGIAFIFSSLYGLLYYSMNQDFFMCLFSTILMTAIFGGIAFWMAYPKVSESLKLSEQPERKSLREQGRQMK